MGYTMKHGNSAVPFKELGSSPAKQKEFDIKSEKTKNIRDYTAKSEKDYSPHNIAARKTEGTLKEQETRRNKVDPDAPGTPGKPGYEPPVKRSDFDEGSKEQKMFDTNQKKK